MTTMPPPDAAPIPARLDLAWSVSARAQNDAAGYASGVLELECNWTPGHGSTTSTDACAATLRAEVVVAGVRRRVAIAPECTVRVERCGGWTHLDILTALHAGHPARLLVRASFERGKLLYCVGMIPELAGFAGATYDAPTGILELYEMRRSALQAS